MPLGRGKARAGLVCASVESGGVYEPRAGSCQHPLSRVLRFAGLRRITQTAASCAAGSPPSPQGAMTRPFDITRGDCAPWVCGTRAKKPRCAAAPWCGLSPRTIRVISNARAATVAAVRSLRGFVCPARPGRRLRSGYSRYRVFRFRARRRPSRPPQRGSPQQRQRPPRTAKACAPADGCASACPPHEVNSYFVGTPVASAKPRLSLCP